MNTHFKQLYQPALQALRTHWPIILIIQALALGVVCSYYWIEGSSELFNHIARYKSSGGLLFAASTTIISGGLLPECLKRGARPSGMPAPPMTELLHQFTMWGILGVIVDRFYAIQAQLFGIGNSPSTLLIKVLFDQFVFTPLIVLPFITSWFLLYEKKGNLKQWFEALTVKDILHRMLPLWATSLCFWPVMLLIIYSLPSALQFPLFLFGNAAYSILMIFIARRQGSIATA